MNLEDIAGKKQNGVFKTMSDFVLGKDGGREKLSALYPDEIEYYACAFELLNSKGETVEFFSFPVLPQSMQETKNSSSSIKKTLGGVVVMNHTTFVPFDIAISGNFGRKMREVDYKSITEDKISNVSGTKTENIDIINEQGNKETVKEGQIETVVIKHKKIFSEQYKTGYGSIKIVERIFKRAQSSDAYNKPYRLIFYNLSLNSNYLVEPLNLQISQTREQNLIWSYSMQLKAIAPAQFIMDKEHYKNSKKSVSDYTQKSVKMTKQSSLINEMLKDVINGMTPGQSLLNQYKNYKAYGQQSGLKLLKQLTDNPLDTITNTRK